MTLPAVWDEPVLRLPAMREGRSAITGPIPIGPMVKRIGQVSDLDLVGGVAVEISADRQRTGEQECRVDGGKLALPNAATGFDVQKMVEEAFVTGGVRLGTLRACEKYLRRFRVILAAKSRTRTPRSTTTGIVASAMPTAAILTGAFESVLSLTSPLSWLISFR